MKKVLALLMALLLPASWAGWSGELGEETPPSEEVEHLGPNLGAQLWITPGNPDADPPTPPSADLWATLGWDGPRGAVELALPATLAAWETRLSVDAYFPISHSWRIGGGLVTRPLTLELDGIRALLSGITDGVSFTFGALLTGEDLTDPFLGARVFMALRINPW